MHTLRRIASAIGLSTVGFFLLAVPPSLASCPFSLAQADVALVPAASFLGQTVKIYATVDPSCGEDVEGIATFRANGTALAQKPFSYKADGRPEEVWAPWTPATAGTHTLRIEVAGNSGEFASVDVSVFIDKDTDGDGKGDANDPDDDNDGVPDTQDQFPLDPSKSKDTDGDGTDDAADSDDDNDGVYDFQEQQKGTDPLKRDTDSDGVPDKEDAFPTDGNKSIAEVIKPAETEPAKPKDATEVQQAAVFYDTAEPVATTSSSESLEGETIILAEVEDRQEEEVRRDERSDAKIGRVLGSDKVRNVAKKTGFTLVHALFLLAFLLLLLAVFFWRKSRQRD